MTIDQSIVENMARDLQALGVQQGGVLLVHASLRALGPLPSDVERPETAIRGLLHALGPQGTLLLPALSYQFAGAHQPFFDVLRTPSCVGALPEYFRTRPGTLRSVHPTHSVCGVGTRAAHLLSDHLLDSTPCGPHSPFARLRDAGGQVLFLGCGLRPNTSMHAIEEQVVPEYLYGPPVEYTISLADGAQTRMRVTSHNFKGYAQRYDRIAGLLDAPALRAGRVLHADCHLLEAPALWETALAAYRRDPLYFVEERA